MRGGEERSDERNVVSYVGRWYFAVLHFAPAVLRFAPAASPPSPSSPCQSACKIRGTEGVGEERNRPTVSHFGTASTPFPHYPP